MKRKKSKKVRLVKGEKFMYFFIVLLITLIPIVNVYTTSIVTSTDIQVEDLKKNIDKQKEENQSLNMQIDELASLENINAVADEYGLTYDNTNILTIK